MALLCRVLGHKWNGCQCLRCGVQRETGHLLELEEGRCVNVCAVCGKREDAPHQWHHCACAHCGETRDKQHDWIQISPCEQVCRICGKERSLHDDQPQERGIDKCTRCGRLRRLTPEEIAQRDEAWSDSFSDEE